MKELLISIVIFCALFSCKEKRSLIIKANNPKLDLRNGVLFYGNDKLNGTLLNDIKVNQTKISTSYLNGKKHGKEIKRYYNDSLAEVRFYVRGYKSGVHKGWWQNGIKKFEFHFNDLGEYNGEVKEWYENGQPFKEFNYKKGKEIGSQKMWQLDGKIRANYIVKNGERYGLIGLKKCYTVTAGSDKLN